MNQASCIPNYVPSDFDLSEPHETHLAGKRVPEDPDLWQGTISSCAAPRVQIFEPRWDKFFNDCGDHVEACVLRVH